MFLSNLRKSFIASGLLLIGFSSCWLWQKNDDRPPGLVAEEKGEFPFSTKEPEVFQCEIVVLAGEKSTTYFYARKGDKWRYDFSKGEAAQTSTVLSDKQYLISYGKKIYTEMPTVVGQEPAQNPLDDFTGSLLKQVEKAVFEEIGREGNLIKYRARINKSEASEIVILVDPNLGLPIKQEFYSATGEKKTLVFSVELRNLTLEVDDIVFAMPADFRKVTIEEFRKAERRSESN